MKNSSNENEERILQEGWQLFQQKGFRGVSTDELCAHCSITKPTLYYYFKDKETLFVRILTRELQKLHAGLASDGSFIERLRAFSQVLLQHFQTGYAVLVHDREHIKKEENRNLLQDTFHNELLGPMIQLMQTGIDEGTLRNGDPEVLTLIYLGLINNFIGKENSLKMEQTVLIDLLVNYFINGAGNNE
jgi:AcrR family transcriptional regulator